LLSLVGKRPTRPSNGKLLSQKSVYPMMKVHKSLSIIGNNTVKLNNCPLHKPGGNNKLRMLILNFGRSDQHSQAAEPMMEGASHATVQTNLECAPWNGKRAPWNAHTLECTDSHMTAPLRRSLPPRGGRRRGARMLLVGAGNSTRTPR